jgi:hypothetical protein
MIFDNTLNLDKRSRQEMYKNKKRTSLKPFVLSVLQHILRRLEVSDLFRLQPKKKLTLPAFLNP